MIKIPNQHGEFVQVKFILAILGPKASHITHSSSDDFWRHLSQAAYLPNKYFTYSFLNLCVSCQFPLTPINTCLCLFCRGQDRPHRPHPTLYYLAKNKLPQPQVAPHTTCSDRDTLGRPATVCDPEIRAYKYFRHRIWISYLLVCFCLYITSEIVPKIIKSFIPDQFLIHMINLELIGEGTGLSTSCRSGSL